MPPLGVQTNVFTIDSSLLLVKDLLSVAVEGISAVGTEKFVILASYPSLLPPFCAGVGIHQHKQLLVSRYLLHSYVQGRSKYMFVGRIQSFSWGIRHKKRNGLGSTTLLKCNI